MPDHAPLTREQRVAIVKAAEAVALTGNLVMLTPEQVLGYEAAVAELEDTVERLQPDARLGQIAKSMAHPHGGGMSLESPHAQHQTWRLWANRDGHGAPELVAEGRTENELFAAIEGACVAARAREIRRIIDHTLAPHEREAAEQERKMRNPPPELMGRRVGGKGEDDD